MVQIHAGVVIASASVCTKFVGDSFPAVGGGTGIGYWQLAWDVLAASQHAGHLLSPYTFASIAPLNGRCAVRAHTALMVS